MVISNSRSLMQKMGHKFPVNVLYCNLYNCLQIIYMGMQQFLACLLLFNRQGKYFLRECTAHNFPVYFIRLFIFSGAFHMISVNSRLINLMSMPPLCDSII